MDAPEEEFYTEERWQNWLERIRDEDLDPENEDSARLLLNLQDDVAIAVAKILRAYDDGEVDEENALDELTDIHETVSSDPEFADEEAEMLVGGVQMSLDCVFYAAHQFIADGVADDADTEGYLSAAAEAESEEDLDRAIGLIACAGTRVIDGESVDVGVTESMEPGYVTEWINGLDSLERALADPEVVEE